MRPVSRSIIFTALLLVIVIAWFWTTNLEAQKTVGRKPVISTLPTPSPSPTPAPRSISIVTTGDILLHERIWNQAAMDGTKGEMNFYPQFSDLQGVISSADLALCHLETPLAKAGVDYSGYPMFNVPPQITSAIVEVGFDMCGTASNHSLDQGFSGLVRTIETLDAAGIPHTGTAASPEVASTPLVMTVPTQNGVVRVGILSYTYGFNGFERDSDKLWSANLIDAPAIIAQAKLARKQGAEIVVVKLHWGTEYASEPNEFQLSVASALADSGQIDLIDGSHTHSVEPLTQIGNTLIAYSHGNLIAAQREPKTIKSEGLIMKWVFTEVAGKFEFSCATETPTFIRDAFPVRIIDVNKALKSGNYLGETKARLELAKSRTDSTVVALGFSKFCE